MDRAEDKAARRGNKWSQALFQPVKTIPERGKWKKLRPGNSQPTSLFLCLRDGCPTSSPSPIMRRGLPQALCEARWTKRSAKVCYRGAALVSG